MTVSDKVLHLGMGKLAEHQDCLLIQLRIHFLYLLIPTHLAILQAIHILDDISLSQFDCLQDEHFSVILHFLACYPQQSKSLELGNCTL